MHFGSFEGYKKTAKFTLGGGKGTVGSVKLEDKVPKFFSSIKFSRKIYYSRVRITHQARIFGQILAKSRRNLA